MQLPEEMRADFIARVDAHRQKRPITTNAELQQVLASVLIALNRRSYLA
jgi:hypothetical protein